MAEIHSDIFLPNGIMYSDLNTLFFLLADVVITL
jgi:hypothetical protein